ncbi:MAG: ribonuclease D [Candidatus Puniceispirillaceae bacterium]
MTNFLYQDDLPDDLDLGKVVAIDTETLGLNLTRDRLCVVQLSSGDGHAHLVQIKSDPAPCPNLMGLIKDETVEKLFHFGRFDIAQLVKLAGEMNGPVFCSKIASKLVRTYTDRHGLAELCRELLSVELSKQQQSSDWGRDELTQQQIDYAASDVLYLHRLKDILMDRLAREGRTEIAQACFAFLTSRATLDLAGFDEVDIFHH